MLRVHQQVIGHQVSCLRTELTPEALQVEQAER